MRVYWGQFVCYSISLFLLVLHVFMHYAASPESSALEDPPPHHQPRHLNSRDVALMDTPSSEENQLSLPYETKNLYETKDNGSLGDAHNHQYSQRVIPVQPVMPVGIRLPHKFTCNNMHNITIKRKIGQGVTKQVFLGTYDGERVAVKMVTRNVIDVLSCIKTQKRDPLADDAAEKSRCYNMPNMKLMKEILLLQQLQHTNLLPLLGFCVRSEETESTSLQNHGIIAVYEYGLRFYTSTLSEWDWKRRVIQAIELSDLLDYLANSPLGSLRISDFKDAHFLLIDGHIKLTDLDDVTSLEPTCNTEEPPGDGFMGCGYGIECVGGMCIGHNARRNLNNFNDMFFAQLLIDDVSSNAPSMYSIRSKLETMSINAHQLNVLLKQLMKKR